MYSTHKAIAVILWRYAIDLNKIHVQSLYVDPPFVSVYFSPQ